MKCHYVWDEEVGRVLIPGCWPVVWSDDIRDCICRLEPASPNGFERERYNEEIRKKNALIKELQEENNYLHKEIKRYIKLLERRKRK